MMMKLLLLYCGKLPLIIHIILFVFQSKFVLLANSVTFKTTAFVTSSSSYIVQQKQYHRPFGLSLKQQHQQQYRTALSAYINTDDTGHNVPSRETSRTRNNNDDDNDDGSDNNNDNNNKKEIVDVLPNGGHITLVGSGPGDPNLLTISAYQILSEPNNTLVISDRLVSTEILNLIQGEVKVARKLPGCAEEAQEEIYRWCQEGLDSGKHVIRLKIGDPFVFGRGAEEVLRFRSYGVEPKVIPGVSAAFSAPLLGSIPVTHRGVSNQVVMCTGYGRNGTSPDLIQYHKEQTVVFLMAVGRLKELCYNLETMAGYPKDTPVAIIERAGCPGQRTVVGFMYNIAEIAERENVKAPSTIVVGNVVHVLLDKENGSDEEETANDLIENCTANVLV